SPGFFASLDHRATRATLDATDKLVQIECCRLQQQVRVRPLNSASINRESSFKIIAQDFADGIRNNLLLAWRQNLRWFFCALYGNSASNRIRYVQPVTARNESPVHIEQRRPMSARVAR